MEKQKRWHLYLILAVCALTLYNILPTLFYYSQPLKKPISAKESIKVSSEIVDRVDSLEGFTVDWLAAQSKNLGLKPLKIGLDPENPKIATISFKTPQDAALFAKTLSRAGALISFVPAELSPDPRSFQEGTTTVTVQRRIGVHLDPSKLDTYFHYIPKQNADGSVSPEYRALIDDRLEGLALGFGGTSEPAKLLLSMEEKENDEALMHLARNIVQFENAFGDENTITKRYFASFTQAPNADKEKLVHLLTSRLEELNNKFATRINKLKEQELALSKEGKFLESGEDQKRQVFESQKGIVDAAVKVVKRNSSLFKEGQTPLTQESIQQMLAKANPQEKTQYLEIGARNPFVDKLGIDWNKDKIEIILHKDVNQIREGVAGTETEALRVENLNQMLYNEIALLARNLDESITPSLSNFTIDLNKLTNSSNLLTLDLATVAKQQIATLMNMLDACWTPSGELSREHYPLLDGNSYANASRDNKNLSLYFYAPVMNEKPEPGFRNGSLYVIAKGAAAIAQKYQDLPASKEKEEFEMGFKNLVDLLRQNGFIGYAGANSGLSQEYRNDFIFELDDFASYLVAATRENFSMKGNKKYATLEFTDVEQRLLTLNKIETQEQEDLVKWKDAYHSAQVSTDPRMKLDVPPPTKSIFWNNMLLSAKKYFRGDERKILRWGLDLSGGKTVRIGLKDKNNQTITDEDDIKQAINELYQRVNRLGVSEVGIRQEGSTIVLDFPGSQGFTASDLIKASAMYFHIVNEKFTTNNPTLSEAVNTFLDEVWNEAVITSRTDSDNVNLIAWQHLGGQADHPGEFHPTSPHARLLYENGLRLAGPKAASRSSNFDDTLSSVAIFRGDDYTAWYGQTYPLIFVFRNYALEGSNLIDIQAGYDPSEGNVLSFGIKGSHTAKEGEKISPRDDFYNWTSQFAEEKITGTAKEAFSHGKGWRMAVILNGTVISAPTLNAALKDSARITGHFSQREINQLAADLKAGSLSFTPQILAEENVSPDLGKEQRTQGIVASLVGIFLVVALMCVYYRFGGLVASVAVLFNLLIIWGVLQNLGAALTLPGLAGIILTVGMAVDANVLVFERIREEFAVSGRLALAISAGYRKAFSAIVDSNLTTIIAALILLNFDSGPIKGFALTLIIGIISSMFTALFMTRAFFTKWVQNPKHKELKMMRLFKETKFDFLSKAKIALWASVVLVVLGVFCFYTQKDTIFGMDFTGGKAITLDLKEKPATNYRLEAASALIAGGAHENDFQIRELSRPNYLRIQFGTGLELPGKPFHHLDELEKVENPLYSYQTNPRIVWIVQTLEKAGLELNPASLNDLQLHWTEMSGQLSETMRNQALIGLGLALLAILIYVTIRFEFKYAISATLGLAHDLVITLGFLALFHLFIPSVQIDLQVIAALMTIIGYSLNDTIIIFDRIREDVRILRKMSYRDVVNHALNATLSRTMMTSSTTLLVLLALVFIGGGTIFNFALILTVGIAIGTLSSLFIAAPLLVFFHGREISKKNDSGVETKSHS